MTDARRSRPVSRPTVRTPAPDGFRVREFGAYAIVTALGAAMLAGHRTGATATGSVTLLTGIGGCAWELARRLRSLSKQRASHALQIARAQARTELKITRSERKTNQNTQRRHERQTLRRAIHERAQAQRTERNVQNERGTRERAQRSARFTALSAEAARLQALPEPAWISALTDVFALRGLRLQTDAAPAASSESAEFAMNASLTASDALPGGMCDMLFVRVEDGGMCVARVLPHDRAGVVADVESLEQRRQQAGSQQAYLIGRGGFSAQAVRLAPRLPLTLVEPNLLAQWNLTKTD